MLWIISRIHLIFTTALGHARAVKSYEQRCGLALALDRVGDRWVLLIVRELLLGPSRYSDLLAALPGVATNLLTQRLRGLEADGVVRRRALPPPAASVVYELTELGRGLEEAVITLTRWGGRFMPEASSGWAFRPQWLVLALRAMLRQDAPGILDRSVVVDLMVDGAVIRVRAGPGEVTIAPGGYEDDPPDARVEIDANAIFAVASGAVPLAAAIEGGVARLTGDAEGAQTALSSFTFAP